MDEGRVEGTHRNRLIQFFVDNPWVGVLGSLASIVGIPLTLYFYFQGVSQPDLVYYVNPVRTVIVKQGAASRLTMSFDGRPLSEDVTVAQVAIWNRGRQAIKAGAVLRPVIIRTEPQVAILEATIRTKSRDVVSLRLDPAQLARGEVGISWNILEQADGGVVQIVYSAGPEIGIKCFGVLEGQPEIRELRYSGKIKSPSEQVAEDKWLNVLCGFLLLVVIVGIVYLVRLARRLPFSLWSVRELVFMTVTALAAIGALTYLTFVYAVPRPPFGFQ